MIHPLQIRRRQIHQSTFLLAGYLYEAMQLIEDLAREVALAPAFSELLFKSIMDQKYRDVLTEFNFSPAFHQDVRSDRKLDELDPDKFDLHALSMACHSSEDISAVISSPSRRTSVAGSRRSRSPACPARGPRVSPARKRKAVLEQDHGRRHAAPGAARVPWLKQPANW